MIPTAIIARPLLALAAALVSAPLAASEPMAVASEPVYQEQVGFADLDLREVADQKALTRRVRVAAGRVCFRQEPQAPRLPMQGTCFAATYRNAKPQVAAAIRLAAAGQVQTAMPLVVKRTFPAR